MQVNKHAFADMTDTNITEAIKKVLGNANPTDWVGPFCLLVLETGMRLNEILDLTWKDIDRDRRIIRVRPNKFFYQTREIPISDALMKVFEKLRRRWELICQRKGKQSKYVFVSERRRHRGTRKGRMNSQSARKTFCQAMARQDLCELTPHSLRYMFARNLVCVVKTDFDYLRWKLGYRPCDSWPMVSKRRK